MSSAFLLYTQPAGPEGFEHGGPIYIKTGAVDAYAGFLSKELANAFCTFWNIQEPVDMIGFEQLGPEFPVSRSNADTVVLFKTQSDLELYFKNPQSFPCEKYFVPLSELQAY